MKSIKLLLMAFVTILSLSVIAQTKEPVKKAETTNKYSCPMHAEITSDKAGKCSKCGMDLKASSTKKDQSTMKMYSCPMHADVTSDKPGKCTKCGMDLKASKG
ncbi:MAG: hypothetical protein NTZ19_08840 [Bacteroidetes bacterium]|nr:hypothetical protein [Bacteroidota bacterium]